MSIKERNELRNLIDEIATKDFDFTNVSSKGKIICSDIKETPYLMVDGVKMHKIFIPKVTVSPSQWDGEYSSDNCGFHYNYYNEHTDEVQYLYPWDIGYELDMTEDEYNAFKTSFDKIEYIETEAQITYAEFTNANLKEKICDLKLFTDLITRINYPLRGWTGETFFETRFGPLFTERNKVLDIIDNIKDFSESDEEKIIKAYKKFLHKELKELEENLKKT
ncbi:MAG: hypothetical protein IKW90_15780 [Lachnospiraceae bacterium]|nr:hypothetical protein [Lachnospiraceae bacterium]